MVSFDGFRPEGSEPIYLQIVGYIKRGIVAGEIPSGDELPSRRMLSALLGVNPNTVQKACRMLEEEGILVSHTGAKASVLALKRLGITLEEAVALIGRAWEEDENK